MCVLTGLAYVLIVILIARATLLKNQRDSLNEQLQQARCALQEAEQAREKEKSRAETYLSTLRHNEGVAAAAEQALGERAVS